MKNMEKLGAMGIVATEVCPMVGVALVGAVVVYGGFMLGGKLVEKIVSGKSKPQILAKSSEK